MTEPNLNPEFVTIGCLLHLPASMTGRVLEVIDDEDVADYLNLLVVRVVRTLVAEDVTPDAVTVLARAQADGTVVGGQAIHGMADRLHELYRSVPVPVSWPLYVQALVRRALRRRCEEMAARVQQAVVSCPLDVLTDLVAAEYHAIQQLQDRLAALEFPPARLRAVSA